MQYKDLLYCAGIGTPEIAMVNIANPASISCAIRLLSDKLATHLATFLRHSLRHC